MRQSPASLLMVLKLRPALSDEAKKSSNFAQKPSTRVNDSTEIHADASSSEKNRESPAAPPNS